MKITVFLAVEMIVTMAYSQDFKIPVLPTGQQIEVSGPNLVKQNLLNNENLTPPKDSSVAKKTAKRKVKKEMKEPIGIKRFIAGGQEKKTPPLASEFKGRNYNSKDIPDGQKVRNKEPITVISSKDTHILSGSGIYQNIIVMNEDIKQIFSSKKLSVEIRGPVAMLRFPAIAGSEVDVQILTSSFRVETFVFGINNALPAQKFIVKSSENEGNGKLNKTKTKKKAGGQAIDTLISIANGKKPEGYKWIASESEPREYMGLRIREIGSYRRSRNEFIVFAITNESTAIMPIKEWDLHNSIVLGSVERTRQVKLMSLDSYQLKQGRTTIMYVGIKHNNKHGGR